MFEFCIFRFWKLRTLDEKSEAEGVAACEQEGRPVVGLLAVKAGKYNFLQCLLASMSIFLQGILAMTNVIRSSNDHLIKQSRVSSWTMRKLFFCIFGQ